MASHITDIYNLDNFQGDRKIYKIRFIFHTLHDITKLYKININDYTITNIESFKDKLSSFTIRLLQLFEQLNIDLDLNNSYKIIFKKKNYNGRVQLITSNQIIRKLYDGQKLINMISRFEVDIVPDINQDINQDISKLTLDCNTECELLIYEIKKRDDFELNYLDIYNSMFQFSRRYKYTEYFTRSYYNVYLSFDCGYSRHKGDNEMNICNKSNKKIKSFMVPIHFIEVHKDKKNNTGFVVLNYYKTDKGTGVFVLKKIINNYDSISILQTIKCHCKNYTMNKISDDDEFNKDIKICECFMKNNIKRIKPFRIMYDDLKKILMDVHMKYEHIVFKSYYYLI